jgi:hypothetical protein
MAKFLHSWIPVWFGLALLGCVLLWRNARLPYPIYGSDELAYMMAAEHSDELAHLYKADPHLQEVGTLLYSKVESLASSCGDIRDTARALNVVMFLLAGGIVVYLGRTRMGTTAGWCALAFCCVQPAVHYVPSFMPEVMYLLGFSAVFAAQFLPGEQSQARPAMLGLLLAAMCHIKPHGVSLLLAACLLEVWLGLESLQTFKRQTRALLVLLASFYVAVVGLRLFSGGGFSLSPSFVGRFYSGSTTGIMDLVHSTGSLGRIGLYFTANCAVIALFFPVAVARFAGAMLPHGGSVAFSPSWRRVVLYTGFAALGTIAMVALFTEQMGLKNSFEAMRLHERYYFFLFPACCLLGLPGAVDGLPAARRWLSVFCFVGAGVTLLVVVKGWLRIYAWDAPDIFASYTHSSYWEWTSPHDFRILLGVGTSLSLVACLMFRRQAPAVLFGWLLFFMVCARLNVGAWQSDHVSRNSGITESGRVLGELMPVRASVTVFCHERYGQGSYLLYGLKRIGRVVEKSRYASLSEGDLGEGAGYCLAPASMYPNFGFEALVRHGEYVLYSVRQNTIAGSGGRPRDPAPPDPARLVPSSLASPGVAFGFNEPEPGLVWSSSPECALRLPRDVQGHIEIRIVVWANNLNPEKNLKVILGSETRVLSLGSEPKEYKVEFSPSSAQRYLRFELPIHQESPWARPLGFGFARLELHTP